MEKFVKKCFWQRKEDIHLTEDSTSFRLFFRLPSPHTHFSVFSAYVIANIVNIIAGRKKVYQLWWIVSELECEMKILVLKNIVKWILFLLSKISDCNKWRWYGRFFVICFIGSCELRLFRAVDNSSIPPSCNKTSRGYHNW